MTSDLISGPDLGAGYLHQLSRDLDGSPTFTYHAQVGGLDANGPPLGPLDPFGFVHPPEPCMFGGPRCWHRRFLLPPEGKPRVLRAYHRYRSVLETMLRQAHRGTSVDVERGIDEVIRRMADPLDSEGIEWYVGGSAAAWLLGASVSPKDIDLGTTRAGVDRLAQLLEEYLIEPAAPTDWPARGIVRGARAFVGTFREGIRVEWAAPVEPRPVLPFEEWSGRPGVARLLATSFRGRPIRVTRPEYALVRAAEKGRFDRLGPIAELLRSRGVDTDLLEALLSRTPLSVEQRDGLTEAMRRHSGGTVARTGVPLEP